MRRWQQIAAGVAVPAILVLGATTVVAGSRDHPEGDAAREAAAPAARAAQLVPPPESRQPPSSESAYVALPPCRVVDSRLGTGAYGTPLGNGTSRNYYVYGTVGFAPQGGKSGGCGVPAGATAVTAVLAAVGPSRGGTYKAWPLGTTEPNAAVFNYADQTSSTGASVTLGSQAGKAITLKNFGGSTDVVIDVTGYYAKPLAGMISDAGAPYAGSSRILGASRLAVGVYSVQVDRNIHYCTATATVWDAGYYASTDTYIGGAYDSITVRVYNAAGAPVDRYFYLIVDC